MRQAIIIFIFTAAGCLGQVTNPNHLEPITPFDSDGYYQAVFDSLIGKEPSVLWMICEPSFKPEFAVVLRKVPAKTASTTPVGSEKKQEWYLEEVSAARQIWHYKEYPANYTGTIELDLLKNVKVDRKRLKIDESVADTLEEAWTSVTRKTRPNNGNYLGTDGVTYLFYSDGHYGGTWCPEVGLPAALVDLSNCLIKLLNSAGDRDALLREALAKAKQIQIEAGKPDKTDAGKDLGSAR